MSISDRLDQMQARADAATSGPWERHHEYDNVIVNLAEKFFVTGTPNMLDYGPQDEANLDFIAAARTDVPALVAALRVFDALHPQRRRAGDHDWIYCGTCQKDGGAWPCVSVRAIAAALGGEAQ